ncbi:MAG: NAD(P)H-hydrate epimerase [Candidatus Omnitrophica bacterium]|nr:NAD(P)H-hydrate epimerase [Candidatus Omnitrophota bacterium]
MAFEEMSMHALDAAAFRALDEKAKTLGMPERILIENASSNMCAIIDALGLEKKGIVVAGRGNNGADVLSCARKLLSRGYDLTIVALADKEPNQEVQFQLALLKKITEVHILRKKEEIDSWGRLSCGKAFILDGILGIGVKGTLNEFLQRIIAAINATKIPVIACDIPSGLSPDTDNRGACAVKADYTITFLAPKRGFFLNGLHFCGRIIVTDIGLSKSILEQI